MTDTLFLKLIAILLITNSHLDALYPIKGLASGGAFGNALFFMLSGLGLAISTHANRMGSILEWFKYRMSRIFPSVWLVVFVFAVILQAHWKYWQWQDYVHHFIFPTRYWFLSALMCFYLLLYPLFRFEWRRWALPISMLLIIPYFGFYFTVVDLSTFSIENNGLFKWIFYFQVVLLGVWIAPHYQSWKTNGHQTTPKEIGALLLCLMGYVGLKFLTNKPEYAILQFLVQWITLPLLYFSLRCAFHPTIEKYFKGGLPQFVLTAIASSTLEIYLLQADFYTLAWLNQLVFPLNVALFFACVLPLAYGLQRLTHPLHHWLKKRS